jgi:GTP pyrophosphokinase
MALALADRVLATERKYEKELQRLIQAVKNKNIAVDEPLVWDAFYYATDAHRGQTRFSGEPYISHPVAVVGILVE